MSFRVTPWAGPRGQERGGLAACRAAEGIPSGREGEPALHLLWTPNTHSSYSAGEGLLGDSLSFANLKGKPSFPLTYYPFPLKKKSQGSFPQL